MKTAHVFLRFFISGIAISPLFISLAEAQPTQWGPQDSGGPPVPIDVELLLIIAIVFGTIATIGKVKPRHVMEDITRLVLNCEKYSREISIMLFVGLLSVMIYLRTFSTIDVVILSLCIVLGSAYVLYERKVRRRYYYTSQTRQKRDILENDARKAKAEVRMKIRHQLEHLQN